MIKIKVSWSIRENLYETTIENFAYEIIALNSNYYIEQADAKGMHIISTLFQGFESIALPFSKVFSLVAVLWHASSETISIVKDAYNDYDDLTNEDIKYSIVESKTNLW